MHSEDDDFSPYPSSNSGKKLASLFEKSNATTKGGNSSLMYKAPKQPKPQQLQSRSSQSVQPASQSQPQSVSDSNLNLILLKVVQTFRLENNEYKSFGKLGAAILGNYNTNQFQLLLYKEKKNIISQTTINSQFWFTVQPNNYATFYDKHKVMWTILFDKTENAIEFNSQIAIIKWCCSDKQSAIVTQDLVVKESKKLVEAEDSVEVSYTITVLLSSNELDKVVETVNSVVITPSVASDSEDGTKIWESTLIGASEGTKKLIILPTSRLGRWKKFVPNDNCSLVLNVDIHSIKDKSDLVNTLPKSSSANLDSSTDQSIKVKGDLIADALSSSPKLSSPKASILSRMAKMGLPTLPFKGARVATVGLSDSDDTTEDDPLSASSSSDGRKKTNTIDDVKKVDSLKQVPLPSIQQSSVVSSQPQVLPSNPPTVNTVTAPTMFNPQHIVTNSDSNISMVTTPRTIMFDSNLIQPTSSATSVITSANCSTIMDPQLPVFLSELRTHNCELRMNINRVTDKIDKVLDKVDNSDPMDKILENLHLLEQKIISKFSQINQRNKEVNDLIMEKTARNTSLSSGSFKEKTSSDPVEQLKTENLELSSALSQSKIKIDELQEKLKKLVIAKSDLEKKLRNEKEERIKFEEEHQYLINVLKLKITEQKDAVNFWQLSVEKVTDKISDLEKTVEKTSKNIKNTDEEIKKIMQDVFKKLLERFPKNSSVYNASVIHRALAEIIKASTFEYLESQKPSSTDVSISESSGRLSGGDSLETVNKESSMSTFTEPDSKSCNDETTKEVKVTVEDKTENVDDKNTTSSLSGNLSYSGKTNSDNEKLNLVIESKEIPSVTDFDISNAELPDIKDVDSSKSVKDEFIPDRKSESNPGDNINSTSKVTKEATDTTGIFVRNREQSSSSSSSMTNDANDENWRSQPPPLLFDDEDKDTDDDWLKM